MKKLNVPGVAEVAGPAAAGTFSFFVRHRRIGINTVAEKAESPRALPKPEAPQLRGHAAFSSDTAGSASLR